MFDLHTIKRMNDRACEARIEDNHSRECSWTEGPGGHIVLHSAKLRNTVCLSPKQAAKFAKRARKIGARPAFMNALIESYFNGGAV